MLLTEFGMAVDLSVIAITGSTLFELPLNEGADPETICCVSGDVTAWLVERRQPGGVAAYPYDNPEF